MSHPSSRVSWRATTSLCITLHETNIFTRYTGLLALRKMQLHPLLRYWKKNARDVGGENLSQNYKHKICTGHTYPSIHKNQILSQLLAKSFLSVFWHYLLCFDTVCWAPERAPTQPVKNWVIRCWHGYLSGARCKWFAYGPADATVTPLSLASLKPRLV